MASWLDIQHDSDLIGNLNVPRNIRTLGSFSEGSSRYTVETDGQNFQMPRIKQCGKAIRRHICHQSIKV